MSEFLINYYDIALRLLQILGGELGVMGFGYYVANIVIFVFIQPGLIILFFLLWRIEKSKNRALYLLHNAKDGENDG